MVNITVKDQDLYVLLSNNSENTIQREKIIKYIGIKH